MSPIDPRELRQSDTPTGVFEDGFRCVKCNYDLTGLPRATVCPECGTTNARPVVDRKRGTGASRAPVAYLRQLGMWLSLCAAAFFGYLFFTIVAAVYEHPITLGLEFLAIMAWVGALWMATKPKPDRFESRTLDTFDDPRWRYASVGSQACHLVTAAFYALSLLPALAFAALASWMGDDSAEKRCQTAAWLLAVGGVGFLVMPVLMHILLLLMVVFVVFVLVGVVLLCVTLIMMAKAANWAVHNAKHKSVVSGRRAVIDRQQAAAAEARLEDRLQQIDGPHPQSRPGRSAPPKGVPVPKSHTIRGSDGANPYDITDE